MASVDETTENSLERRVIRPVIACPDCDLLQREVVLSFGGAVRCRRCGALMYRKIRDGPDRTLLSGRSGG